MAFTHTTSYTYSLLASLPQYSTSTSAQLQALLLGRSLPYGYNTEPWPEYHAKAANQGSQESGASGAGQGPVESSQAETEKDPFSPF